MIRLKTPSDIQKLKEGGKVSRKILDFALNLCSPGISTLEIDQQIEKILLKNGVESWFSDVDNYKYASCIAVNEVWVHGIPNKRQLSVGDVVSIDMGIKYKGYFLDNCWTIVVQDGKCGDVRKCFFHKDKGIQKFLEVSSNALMQAIETFQIGSRTGDISSKMQEIIEDSGYSTIKEYTGHGVGFSFHEEPFIPCFGTKGAGSLLEVGTVLAIEVMASMGDWAIDTADDGWSVIAKDGSITSMFEHTIVLTEKGPEILTI